MNTEPAAGFTGLHMLWTMLAFFAVIIGVNVTMAVLANTSWTGLVVKNSYVASQEFNERLAEARAQDALGWTSTLAIGNGEVRYGLSDAAGAPVAIREATVMVRRPSTEAQDETFQLAPDAEGFALAARSVRDGIWIVEVNANVGRARPFRETQRIRIVAGILQ